MTELSAYTKLSILIVWLWECTGQFGDRLFLKTRRVGRYVSHVSNVIWFLKVQVILRPLTCPRGKSLLVECHLLDDQIDRRPYYCQRECISSGGFRRAWKWSAAKCQARPTRHCPTTPNSLPRWSVSRNRGCLKTKTTNLHWPRHWLCTVLWLVPLSLNLLGLHFCCYYCQL